MNSDNICSTCSINQACCTSLTSLRVSRDEFKNAFIHHRQEILFKEHLGVYEVSGSPDSCPNWENNRCLIYEKRPMECRIYPYTIGGYLRVGRIVFLTYHDRTCCPHKEHFKASHGDVRIILQAFVDEAFGGGVRPVIIRDGFPWRGAGFLISLAGKFIRKPPGKDEL